MALENSISAFIGCEAEYDESRIVIFGAPYDCTTSYRPGTRFGPRDIRAESFGIETYSPYQDKDLTDCKIFDSGDLELRFGSPESALDDIQARTAEILSDGKLPIMLGGEHLVTLGQFRAIAEKYNNSEIVLDAEDFVGVNFSVKRERRTV